jgi:GT2 family glycosyltransferase
VIDVIIPVYKGFEQTTRCIESVLAASQREPFQVVAIDDASPEPNIAAWLDSAAAAGRLQLVRNEHNVGFVQSVNRGMALHPDRDVVLLNSDTEVANDWLDRLRAAVYAHDKVATATPFSNNATICSYPFEGWQGAVPGTLGLAELDRLFADTNRGEALFIPTAVGFCMYIRRAALDAVGLFDAARFGRGYGEENDFCMRAGKAGWRHVLATNVFVFHEGGVSFSSERFALIRAAGEALVAVHPEYHRMVHDFILADPARRFRDAVDLARMKRGHEEGAALLKERSDERARLLRGLLEIEKVAAERDSQVSQLNYALDHAGERITERDRAIAELTGLAHQRMNEIMASHEEMERLRAGLKHAESLAFSRLAELERIHSSRLWKLLSGVARRVRGASS